MENRSMTSTDTNFPVLVSEAFIEVMKQVDRIADTNLPVLLTGESGAGITLVASIIHQRSSRRDQPFIAVDCAAIPAESIESELFGLWEQACGTVVLEEITAIPISFQEKLARALQSESQQVEARVIAASQRNVEDEVAAGRLSYDLYCCLKQASIVLPPLRERHEDTDRVSSLNPAPVNDDWVTLSVIEGRYVARVLEHTGGNKQAAARVLAVDRKTLDRMIKRHHIDSNHVKALRAKASSHS